jgi:23S rRNA pseudouridine2605 synthase
VTKTYHVQIDRVADAALLQLLAAGVATGDGEILRAGKVSILRGGERNTWLEIVLHEGKNRQIRRMLKHFDVEVLRLVRVAIGPLVLEQLPKGKARRLSVAEKSAMDRAMNWAMK